MMESKGIMKSVIVLCCTSMAVGLSGISGCKTAPPAVPEKDVTQLYLYGVKLSAEQAAGLEKQLNGSSADVEIIGKLMGYYAVKSLNNKDLRIKRQEHIFWLIKNYPRTSIFHNATARLDEHYDDVATGRKLWLEQLEKNPDDPVILWNVASSMFAGDKKLAEACLLKGEALEPDKFDWSSQLGLFYSVNQAPEKSLLKYQAAYGKLSESARRHELPNLAKMSLVCGKYEDAEKYAKDMLQIAAGDKKEQWDTGNLIFHGNYILGKIAMAQGRIADAEKYLLAAGKTPGSPQLNSFGPNLQLAAMLFDAGKKDTVIEFLTSISTFWKKDLCNKAIAQIRQGENPFKSYPAKYDAFSFRTFE